MWSKRLRNNKKDNNKKNDSEEGNNEEDSEEVDSEGASPPRYNAHFDLLNVFKFP